MKFRRLTALPRAGALLILALLGASLALPAAAQWKWRDKGGQIQYSDLPPPAGTPDKDVLQRPNSSQRVAAPAAPASEASAPALMVRPVEPELEDKRRKAEQEQAAKKKADDQRVAAAKAENCQRAQGALRTFDSGVRVARTNDKGEQEILDDKQRAEEARRARDVVATDCAK